MGKTTEHMLSVLADAHKDAWSDSSEGYFLSALLSFKSSLRQLFQRCCICVFDSLILDIFQLNTCEFWTIYMNIGNCCSLISVCLTFSVKMCKYLIA